MDLVARLAAYARRRPSPRTERVLLVVSALVFTAAAVAAAVSLPPPAAVRWGLLALAGVAGMPALLALNAVEFQLIGRFVGQRIRFGPALKITVFGSAANLLPAPGSVLVRSQALAANNARFRDAAAGSVAAGLLSVAVALLLAGVAQAPHPAVLVAVLGAGAAALAIVVLWMLPHRSVRLVASLFGLEVAYVGAIALLIWALVTALGVEATVPSALALTAAREVATAVGFFPAGLGIREVLVGAVSPLVGLPANIGLAAAVIERLMWFVALAAAAGLIARMSAGSTDVAPTTER